MCVTLTPAAANFMRRLTRMGAQGPGAGFRLAVRPGGCSGFSSDFTIESAPTEGDAVIEQNGARLFLAADSCELLRGHEIDFVETRMDSSFKYTKPGQPHVCGCGAGDPGSKSKVIFMRPSVGCVKA